MELRSMSMCATHCVKKKTRGEERRGEEVQLTMQMSKRVPHEHGCYKDASAESTRWSEEPVVLVGNKKHADPVHDTQPSQHKGGPVRPQTENDH